MALVQRPEDRGLAVDAHADALEPDHAEELVDRFGRGACGAVHGKGEAPAQTRFGGGREEDGAGPGGRGARVRLAQGAVLVVRGVQAAVVDVQAVAATVVAVRDQDVRVDRDREGVKGDQAGRKVALEFGRPRSRVTWRPSLTSAGSLRARASEASWSGKTPSRQAPRRLDADSHEAFGRLLGEPVAHPTVPSSARVHPTAYPVGPTGCSARPERTMTCSIVSTRRWTARSRAARSRASVALPERCGRSRAGPHPRFRHVRPVRNLLTDGAGVCSTHFP